MKTTAVLHAEIGNKTSFGLLQNTTRTASLKMEKSYKL